MMAKSDLATKDDVVKIVMEATDAILEGMDSMFQDQNRRNDEKFATKQDLKRVETKVDKLGNSVSKLESRVGKLEIKVDRLGEDFGDFKDDLRMMKKTSLGNESRISRLEAAVA